MISVIESQVIDSGTEFFKIQSKQDFLILFEGIK